MKNQQHTPRYPDDARCVDADPELFFPVPEHPRSVITLEAKRWCASCLVISECLEGALWRNERFGIWGGMTTPERDTLKARRINRAIRAEDAKIETRA